MPHAKHILFIAVDDLRPEINCFGKKKLHTPNMDRIAASGLRFDRAYCQIPICMPSRASLMSGVRPIAEWRDHIIQMCPNGEPSLPGHLKASGYTTVSIGKVYHYNDDDEASWTKRYTDTFYEQEYAFDGYCSGYQLKENQQKVRNFHKHLMGGRKDLPLPPLWECVDAPDSIYPDGIIAERAIEALREHQGKAEPLFLAVGFYRPHLPWATPRKYWDLYRREDVDLADNPFFPEDGIGISTHQDLMHYGDDEVKGTFTDFGHYSSESFPVLSEAKQRELIHAYWASVSFTDAQIGKVLDEMERLGMLEDTIIVLWGDNGWHLGEHKLWAKATNFEESTRIPLMISAPGRVQGESTKALVELVDLYPTLCDLAGLEQPEHLEGLSMLPLLQNPQRPWKKGIFSRSFDGEVLRMENCRFTRYAKATPQGDTGHLPNTGSMELFDLARDPRENVNVAKRPEYADLVKQCNDTLDKGWRSVLPIDGPKRHGTTGPMKELIR